MKYTDENGIVKPLARGEIIVSVNGGKLRACGNACPYNEKGFLTDTTDTYFGEALAIIEPLGEVLVTAKSPFGNQQLEIVWDDKNEA